MADNPSLFRKDFTVRSIESQPDGRAHLQSICNYLQETAGYHALQLEFDVTDLLKKNHTWFLYRLDLKMDRYPRWRDEVTIESWTSGADNLRAYRDFLILDAENNVLGKALSYWMIINLENRRPVSIPDSIRVMELADRDHTLELTSKRLSAPVSSDYTKSFDVQFAHLDINNHVNNVHYVNWVLETVPLEIRKERNLVDCKIEFRSESEVGNTLKAEARQMDSTDNTQFRHQIVNTNTNAVVIMAETSWR